MQARFLARQASEMAELVPVAIEQAAREITPSLSRSACTLAERLERFVASNTRRMGARLAPPRGAR
jgi:serine/threonine-protein kinase HipA